MSQNIDFTTLKGFINSLPFASTTYRVASLGEELTMDYRRYGDLVITYLNAVITYAAGYDQVSFGNCPTGYKPNRTAMVIGNMSAGQSNTGCFDLTMNTDGTITGSCPAVSGATRVQGLGVWVTSDAFPS